MDVTEREEKADIILHDADTKFTKEFKEALKSKKMRPHQVSPVSPNLNAYVERFIQTIRQECLDQFDVLGERHLDHLVQELVDYYYTQRPHQGIGNVLLTGVTATESPKGIVCRERLGGLLKHYERRAA